MPATAIAKAPFRQGAEAFVTQKLVDVTRRRRRILMERLKDWKAAGAAPSQIMVVQRLLDEAAGEEQRAEEKKKAAFRRLVGSIHRNNSVNGNGMSAAYITQKELRAAGVGEFILVDAAGEPVPRAEYTTREEAERYAKDPGLVEIYGPMTVKDKSVAKAAGGILSDIANVINAATEGFSTVTKFFTKKEVAKSVEEGARAAVPQIIVPPPPEKPWYSQPYVIIPAVGAAAFLIYKLVA